MKKDIIINATSTEIRVAITEDDRLAEIFLEVPDKERHVGSIYLGRVERVVQGMNAAFIDIGEPQDAFLHFSDVGSALDEFKDLLDDRDDDDDDDADEQDDAETTTAAASSTERGGRGSQKSRGGAERKHTDTTSDQSDQPQDTAPERRDRGRGRDRKSDRRGGHDNDAPRAERAPGSDLESRADGTERDERPREDRPERERGRGDRRDGQSRRDGQGRGGADRASDGARSDGRRDQRADAAAGSRPVDADADIEDVDPVDADNATAEGDHNSEEAHRKRRRKRGRRGGRGRNRRGRDEEGVAGDRDTTRDAADDRDTDDRGDDDMDDDDRDAEAQPAAHRAEAPQREHRGDRNDRDNRGRGGNRNAPRVQEAQAGHDADDDERDDDMPEGDAGTDNAGEGVDAEGRPRRRRRRGRRGGRNRRENSDGGNRENTAEQPRGEQARGEQSRGENIRSERTPDQRGNDAGRGNTAPPDDRRGERRGDGDRRDDNRRGNDRRPDDRRTDERRPEGRPESRSTNERHADDREGQRQHGNERSAGGARTEQPRTEQPRAEHPRANDRGHGGRRDERRDDTRGTAPETPAAPRAEAVAPNDDVAGADRPAGGRKARPSRRKPAEDTPSLFPADEPHQAAEPAATPPPKPKRASTRKAPAAAKDTPPPGETPANPAGKPSRRGKPAGRRGGRDGDSDAPIKGSTADAKLPTFQTKRSGEVTIALEKGQDVIVQVTRESYASKGVRVTTKVSLPGRFLVLLPLDPAIGISRKVQNMKERRRLRRIARGILPEGHGCIIRTVAQDKEEAVIRQDLMKLIENWREIEQKLKDTNAPSLLYKDQSIAATVMRDLFTPDTNRVVIDNKALYTEIRDYVEWAAPGLADKVELYTGSRPIFDEYGMEREMQKIAERRVYIPSGGYIILDQTEAMMVIDVNSGRYAGKKDQELNSLRTNLESAREIARQIRLRDIGGLIVIDFIDLYDEKNRKKVYDELKKEMRRDRAKSVVLPMTQFGLVQMTRQRIRQQVVQTMSEPCPVCAGSGLVQSRSTVARNIERWLQRFREGSREFRLTLSAHPHVINYLSEGANSRLTAMMMKYFVRLKVVPDESLMVSEFHFFSTHHQADITEKYLEDIAARKREEKAAKRLEAKRKDEQKKGDDERDAAAGPQKRGPRRDDRRGGEERRSDDRRADGRRGEERRGEERRSDDRRGEERRGDDRRSEEPRKDRPDRRDGRRPNDRTGARQGDRRPQHAEPTEAADASARSQQPAAQDANGQPAEGGRPASSGRRGSRGGRGRDNRRGGRGRDEHASGEPRGTQAPQTNAADVPAQTDRPERADAGSGAEKRPDRSRPARGRDRAVTESGGEPSARGTARPDVRREAPTERTTIERPVAEQPAEAAASAPKKRAGSRSTKKAATPDREAPAAAEAAPPAKKRAAPRRTAEPETGAATVAEKPKRASRAKKKPETDAPAGAAATGGGEKPAPAKARRGSTRGRSAPEE